MLQHLNNINSDRLGPIFNDTYIREFFDMH